MTQRYCETETVVMVASSERSRGSIPLGKGSLVIINETQFCMEVKHD